MLIALLHEDLVRPWLAYRLALATILLRQTNKRRIRQTEFHTRCLSRFSLAAQAL